MACDFEDRSLLFQGTSPRVCVRVLPDEGRVIVKLQELYRRTVGGGADVCLEGEEQRRRDP